ncbi:lysine-2,3-aminomutase-like protein [Methylocystis sp. WRRC1]|uniref:lysine-2,3-aminomutase-like protein n=1 Tax=Methylocystis sp. WRRC1 TaxID=1732014 RepID=UPI001D137E48|nr:lysine-2,3-aminomutase-like protein [Methylocystis sp. WRRC1]MCC3244501.1 lysine-2,3-aminomutase-like protein [Methylocystis sp. WRRC1]
MNFQHDASDLAEPDRPRVKKTLLSLDDLAAAGFLGPGRAQALRGVESQYSVAVTPDMAALIDAADPADPIARQFLPDARELVTLPQELADPIGDDAHSPAPGLVHRYPDRVLLKLLTVCPVYCRFCFRRETVGRGKGDVLSPEATDAALEYIAGHRQIFEVILTGGDPLMLSGRRLSAVARRLAKIPHVAVLRVHTRAPTAAPDLVTQERLDALRVSGKALYVALHVNHSRELAPAARAAIARLHEAGATLLSQTVLLKGVNDDADTLERLMRDLVALRVKPYYLHHPDLAPGTSHFRLSLDAGRRIHAELTRRVTGVAVPRYVLDIPGGFGKAPVSDAETDGEGGWRIADRSGPVHLYRDDP